MFPTVNTLDASIAVYSEQQRLGCSTPTKYGLCGPRATRTLQSWARGKILFYSNIFTPAGWLSEQTKETTSLQRIFGPSIIKKQCAKIFKSADNIRFIISENLDTLGERRFTTTIMEMFQDDKHFIPGFQRDAPQVVQGTPRTEVSGARTVF